MNTPYSSEYKTCSSNHVLKVCQFDVDKEREAKNIPFAPRQLLGADQILGFDEHSYDDIIPIASNDFSSIIYNDLARSPGNQLFCALSLHIALGLVLLGSRGRTAGELSKALQLKGIDKETINLGYQDTISQLQKVNTLKLVAKIYPKKRGVELNNDFIKDAQRYFLMDIESIDYEDLKGAAQTINKYVADHTDNKILHFLDPRKITSKPELIVVNAIYFNPTWKISFQTINAIFKVSTLQKVPTTMMLQTAHYEYKKDDALKATILKLDCENGEYSMIVILPDAVDGLSSVEDILGKTTLETLLRGLQRSLVEVKIPKFKIEKSMDLKDVLSTMGNKNLFKPTAELKGIVNGDLIYVSNVIQNTFLEVDEKGATKGADIKATKPTRFTANHPFHFKIINNRTNAIVFSGRLVNP